VHREGLAEYAVLWLYLAALAWTPFWYGSNDLIAWGINAVLFPGLAILYEASLLVRAKPHPVALRELAVPASMFVLVVGWIAFQTLTWDRLPFANPIWQMAAGALARKVHGSISVDRDLTNLALMRLLTAASAFWVALQLCRDGRRARLLIASIAGIGAAYAVYGLIAAKLGQLPWLDIPASDYVTATFINHDSFATYAGICGVAAVGLILRHFQNEMDAVSGSWRYSVSALIEACGPQGVILLAAGFVLLVALLLTGSRGGTIATGIAIVALGLLMRRRGAERDRQSLTTIAVGLIAVVAMVFAFGGVIGGALEERGISDANRLAVYTLTIRSILDAPITGFGYGTFREVFRMYRDRSLSVDGIWGQAHDTYLEVLQGLGLVFGLLLIGCVVLLVFRCIKGAWHRQENAIVPQVAASAACLVGVHALVDFSLQIQAVALTFMALLGAGVAQSESSRISLKD